MIRQGNIIKSQFFYITCFMLLGVSQMACAQNFITVNDGTFIKGGKPYHYVGTNFWYGMNLGAADKPRLINELDRLNKIGIKNLRIMAGSEGAYDAPWCIQPAVQTAPGQYNESLLQGLDFLLAEMQKRGMEAVVCLNNFWPWSGGFAQYVSWANDNEAIPYPMIKGGDWKAYQDYATRFYNTPRAVQWYNDYLEHVINRTNTITQLPYKNDTTIMAWQLANEPRGGTAIEYYRSWLHETAKYIKGLDSNHLVSIGSEGNTPSTENGNDFEKDHDSQYIDYCTFHLWPQNWGWYDPAQGENMLAYAMGQSESYINDHIAIAVKLNKPLVLEEFGLSRDGNSHDPKTTVKVRDRYYSYVFTKLLSSVRKTKQVAGVNFWAWAGEGRPRESKTIWKPGDDFIGDPPHEPQGWYSVYDKDKSTIKIIKQFASAMAAY